MSSLELLPEHATLWHRFEAHRHEQRLGHAILITAPRHALPERLAQIMSAALFCTEQTSPCGQCQSCRLLSLNEHPDLNLLAPDKLHGTIKVEQVRALSQRIYVSGQLGPNRVVIINPADKMNASCANALLKILEEPPDNVWFLLVAEQISTIPPTILSRCQHWPLLIATSQNDSYLLQGQLYSADSDRGKLFAQLDMIVDNLMELQCGKVSVNHLAAKWSSFEINDLVWLLYLINSQMIFDYFNGMSVDLSVPASLYPLAMRIKPVRLFAQIDRLNEISRHLNHTVSMNQLLWLEDLLLGYL